MEINRSALVPHSAMDMFRLVQDVPSYPQFLSWCKEAEFHEQGADYHLASLVVTVKGVAQTFTTRNRFVSGEYLSLSLVKGPFSHLSGEWRFSPLGEDGCKVTLSLGFEFSSSFLSAAFRRGFTGIADKLIFDFTARADDVYGA